LAAIEKGYAAPIWMTFKQALDLKANVRKGEHGSLVVYADKIIRTETTESGEEAERAIPFMKGYTVFNVEQIEVKLTLCELSPVQQLQIRNGDGRVSAAQQDVIARFNFSRPPFNFSPRRSITPQAWCGACAISCVAAGRIPAPSRCMTSLPMHSRSPARK
jgi:hypothetical protein